MLSVSYKGYRNFSRLSAKQRMVQKLRSSMLKIGMKKCSKLMICLMVARFKAIRVVDHQHSVVLANYTDCKSLENILFLIVKLLNSDMKKCVSTNS